MTYEEKIILANEYLIANGEDTLSSFEFEGIEIINPYFDETSRQAVNPVEYYGEKYIIWKYFLKHFEAECLILFFNEKPIIVYKYSEDDYSLYYENVSFRGNNSDLILKFKELFPFISVKDIMTF